MAGVVTFVIVAVVALVTGLGACQGAADNYTGYLSEVRALAQSSDRAGGELTSLLGSSVRRAPLGRRLLELATQEQHVYDQAQLIRPPGPLRQVHEELLAALELRATGLAGLAQAVAGLGSAKPVVPSMADALAAQARLLTTSDVVWNELYRMPVAAQLQANRIGNLVVPESRLVPNPQLVSAASLTRLLQRAQGLRNSGTAPLLKPGTTGSAVKSWQRKLNRWLRTQPSQQPLPIDGAFGALTDAATKAFQQAAGLTADGTVGPATRRALAQQLARSHH
jgi:murein L,D-transpeptidase YcbB/YkuD